ncbi:hypothetical protein DP113_33850 (plasmid) [Brasilonema octagenarum UFV-E1]|uniref:Uncharacterized protein n=3 Tax=Scytonemataceae TaxID=1182 RepID=A0A856MMP1_9CYAN|nr:hypothetical protein [Brasilonema octagenarum UFV-OR1]QDL12705.1 hypothetical protein DP114_33740 [Brasilonema sennae CENA114]QDL19100.1 hypothetical protein DP113_33850 [Brasilonema octagenarum UFV-E1]
MCRIACKIGGIVVGKKAMPRRKKLSVEEPNEQQEAAVEIVQTEERASVPIEKEKAERDEPTTEETGVVPVEAELITEGEDAPLSGEEKELLLQLERQIEDSFYAAATALRAINEKRLYRESYRTFTEYCESRFGFKRRQAYHYIEAANVTDTLAKSARAVHVLPTTEYQIRPLSTIKDPEKQVEVWMRAVEKAGGRAPSHEIVKEVKQEILGNGTSPKPPSNPLQEGDVCVIKRSTDALLSDRAGFWGVVTEEAGETVTLELFDRTVPKVAITDVVPLKLSKKEEKERAELLSRLKAIYEGVGVGEDALVPIFRHFGTLTARATLTRFEKKLLSFLERQFKDAKMETDDGDSPPQDASE